MFQVWQNRVEEALATIESTQQQHKVLAALKEGTEQLKQLQKEFTLEDIQTIMEDSAEASAMQNQISQLLGQAAEPGVEEAAERELEELESQLADQAALEMPSLPKVPAAAVPSKVPSPAVAGEEEEEEEQQTVAPLLAS